MPFAIPPRRITLSLVASLTITACRGGGAAADSTPDSRGATHSSARLRAVAEDSSHRHAPGYIVDSIIPIEDALRHFRADLPAATRLHGGATSRDALVRGFVRALERRDPVALARMAMTRAEFAYLVYPSSPYTRAPYRQQPEIVWMLQRRSGQSGATRLLERLGGRSLGYMGHACSAVPTVEGANRLWRDCRLRYRQLDGGETTGRLFGVIVERMGQFKFVNYANDL